ncbi:MAG: hypothetical protein ACFFFH_10550 [Candidatus Thorarchaeota archaeon]
MDKMNIKEAFLNRLEYSRTKQSDHLNAMIGVGLGLIFGIFSIPKGRWLIVLVFFSIVIFVIFFHFYGRYYYWRLEECALEAILDIEDTANFITYMKNKDMDIESIRNKKFVELLRSPAWKQWINESMSSGLLRWLFLSIYRRGKEWEITGFVIFGLLTLSVLYA